jgi:hypothetical protein
LLANAVDFTVLILHLTGVCLGQKQQLPDVAASWSPAVPVGHRVCLTASVLTSSR